MWGWEAGWPLMSSPLSLLFKMATEQEIVSVKVSVKGPMEADFIDP
jgi:hypothetical protein